MNRRRFLTSTAVLTVGTIAGCTSDEEPSASASGGNDGENEEQASDSGGGGEETTSEGNSEDEKELEIMEHSLEEGDVFTKVVGKVKNVSGEEQSYVGINAKFFNENDERIGEGMDNATDVATGTVVNFECIYTGDGEVARYEIEATTSPLA